MERGGYGSGVVASAQRNNNMIIVGLAVAVLVGGMFVMSSGSSSTASAPPAQAPISDTFRQTIDQPTERTAGLTEQAQDRAPTHAPAEDPMSQYRPSVSHLAGADAGHGGNQQQVTWESVDAPPPPREYDWRKGALDEEEPTAVFADWARQPDDSEEECAIFKLVDKHTAVAIPVQPVSRSCMYGRVEESKEFARLGRGQLSVNIKRCPYGASYAVDTYGAVEYSPVDPASANKDSVVNIKMDREFAYVRCRAVGAVDVLTQLVPSAAALQRVRSLRPQSSTRPNVLVLHVRSMSRAHAFRALGRTVSLLRRLADLTHGNYHSFHFQRYHALSNDPAINLAALLSGRVSYARFESNRARWLWEDARDAGYVTSVGNNGCDKEAPTFTGVDAVDHTGLSSMACSVMQHELGIQSSEEGDPEQLCVAGRRFHQYALDYAVDVLTTRAYGAAPRLVVQSLYDAHEPSMMRSFSLDDALLETIKRVVSEAPNTVIALVSDTGNTVSDYYFGTQGGRSEAVLPAMFLAAPREVLDAAGSGVREALATNQARLVGPSSVHTTLMQLIGATSAGTAASAEANAPSLLRELPLQRSCADAGVQPAVCQCGAWVPSERDGRGLAEFALSEVNALVWKPRYHRSDAQGACQPFRLAEVLDVVRLSFPAQESAPAAVPLHPTPHRFRVRFRTKGGTGFGPQLFEADVVDFEWRLKRQRDRHVHMHNAFHAPMIRRTTALSKYTRCLRDEGEDATPAEFCVCDLGALGGEDDDSGLDGGADGRGDEGEPTDTSAPDGAVRVPMVQKDDVEMLRWSHNGVELFEIINMKNADVVFKVSMEIGINGVLNVRGSHSMPVWRYVPAYTTRALMVLEREKRDQPWTWNFDWRWDVVEAHQRQESGTYITGQRLRSTDAFYRMKEGVALSKLFDLHPTRGASRTVSYQVTNLRNNPIEYELEVFVNEARRVRAISGSHHRQRVEPGQTKLMVIVEAVVSNADKAREALQSLKHVGSWQSLSM